MDNLVIHQRYAAKGMPVFSQSGRHHLFKRRKASRSKTKTERVVKLFECPFSGCDKTFYNYCTLIYHKNKHSNTEFAEEIGAIAEETGFEEINRNDNKESSSYNNSWAEPREEPSPDKCLVGSVPSNGFKSITNVSKYFTTSTGLGQKLCICLFCGHKTFGHRRKFRMTIHINGKHLRYKHIFRCDFEGCGKVYHNPDALKYHKTNHFCGFGISKDPNKVCANENLNRFRKSVFIDGLKLWKCTFSTECPYVTSSTGSLKRHIHEVHVCPTRQWSQTVANKSMNGINSIDILQRFDQFCDKCSVEDQPVFKCRICGFLSHKLHGILAHIKNKHFRTNISNLNHKSNSFLKPIGIRVKQKDESEMDCKEEGKDRDIACAEEQEKQQEAKENIGFKWLPFHCHRCDRTFEDLTLMRKHCSTHIIF